MDEVLKIVNDIKAGNIKPVYFLMGEESYYIDKLSDYIEKNVLNEVILKIPIERLGFFSLYFKNGE